MKSIKPAALVTGCILFIVCNLWAAGANNFFEPAPVMDPNDPLFFWDPNQCDPNSPAIDWLIVEPNVPIQIEVEVWHQTGAPLSLTASYKAEETSGIMISLDVTTGELLKVKNYWKQKYIINWTPPAVPGIVYYIDMKTTAPVQSHPKDRRRKIGDDRRTLVVLAAPPDAPILVIPQQPALALYWQRQAGRAVMREIKAGRMMAKDSGPVMVRFLR